MQQYFGIRTVNLTKPLFFSRISANKRARTKNDEYWHSHIDKIQAG